jgi:hypothetical protein
MSYGTSHVLIDNNSKKIVSADDIETKQKRLSRADTDLVEPDSIHKVAQAALASPPPTTAGSTSTPPRATPTTVRSALPRLAPPARPAAAARAESRVAAASVAEAAAVAAVASGVAPLWSVCRFKRNIPCSVDIVGDSLGLSGAPSCAFCNNEAHYHGECPMKWGGAGTALPGFALDGQRIAADWKRANSAGHQAVDLILERHTY